MSRFLIVLLAILTVLQANAQSIYETNNVPATETGIRMKGFAEKKINNEESVFKNIIFRSIGPTVMSGRVVDIEFVDVEIPTSVTAINEISQKTDFCYPNPATDILNFKETGNYEIYNSIGQKVLSLENIQCTDISALNSGMYFVKSETRKTQKIIVNN